MIKEIPINESHIFAFSLSGELEEQDYKAFRPKLEKLLEKEKRLSLLIKLENFKGWSAKAAWEDLKLGLTHDDEFIRIAIVGEGSWQKIASAFGSFFTDTDFRYFDDESEALEWLLEVKNEAEQDEYIGYRHLLVANDFSKYSEKALKKAIQIAQAFDAKITVFHAAEILSAEIYPEMGELSIPVMVENPELAKKQLDRLNKKLEESISHLEVPDGLITTSVEEGQAEEAIREFSIKNNVDMIVMGSHGRRGLAKLLGSSTNGVINQAPCDVLVVSSRI